MRAACPQSGRVKMVLLLVPLLLTNLLLCCCLELELCSPQRADEHPQGRAEQAGDAGVVFKLRAFTRDFYLRLTPDSGFLAPPESRAAAPDLRDCFYSGDVNADPDSFAALSLCGGLSGGFSYDGMEYFISPSGRERAAPGDPAERTHVIRRRGRVHLGGNVTRRCGVAPDGNFSAPLERYTHLRELRTVLGGPGRSKRFASIPRFVEVLVVADESMADAHGEDLQHYLLTLMSVVARLYKHPSILNPISVVVVGFMVLGGADKGPKVSSNAALTLRNFCSWQKKLNKHSDKHPDYWDTAILFTKQVGGAPGVQAPKDRGLGGSGGPLETLTKSLEEHGKHLRVGGAFRHPGVRIRSCYDSHVLVL